MTENKQIEFLARAIVNRLEDRSLVEFSDAEQGISLVAQALERNFAEYDAFENEARLRLARAMPRQPRNEEIELEMRRIAAERGVVL